MVVSRQEVENKDIEPALSVLSRLITSPDIAREYMGKVDISFDGYNDNKEELFEIPEVRNYV